MLGGVRATAFAAVALAALLSSGWLYVTKASVSSQRDAAVAALVKEKLDRITAEAAIYESKTKALAKVGADYERELAAAQSRYASVREQLRTSVLQLREFWSCEGEGSSGSSESKERTRLREEAAARIIQIGAEADAQVRALQEAVKEYEDGREGVRSGSE